ncbi:hypothetical protein [Estrella lausannensis]|uniref:Putative membrane protein n=1 Tax=Estrella lausannensis TaxID=483423 RepID=A0A0H5DP21_9BACT|nr:hypothetical protein [Estrella lausannensis]CRX38082.1 putative membrane protein [Estrella lausannensis]
MQLITPLSRRKLKWPLFISLLLTLLAPAAPIPLPIFFLSPCIVLALYRFKFAKAFMFTFFLGLFLDLFSLETRLGLIGTALALSLAAVSPFKKVLFADQFYTLPLMTFLFSFFATMATSVLFPGVLDAEFVGKALFTEGLIMPFADACYAFTVFILPEILYGLTYRLIRRNA